MPSRRQSRQGRGAEDRIRVRARARLRRRRSRSTPTASIFRARSRSSSPRTRRPARTSSSAAARISSARCCRAAASRTASPRAASRSRRRRTSPTRRAASASTPRACCAAIRLRSDGFDMESEVIVQRRLPRLQGHHHPHRPRLRRRPVDQPLQAARRHAAHRVDGDPRALLLACEARIADTRSQRVSQCPLCLCGEKRFSAAPQRAGRSLFASGFRGIISGRFAASHTNVAITTAACIRSSRCRRS